MKSLNVANDHRMRQIITNLNASSPPNALQGNNGKHLERLPKERVAHYVAVRLKNVEQKFSGSLGKCWMKSVDEYQKIARGYKLNTAQKLQYLRNILCKDAQRFYMSYVQKDAVLFQQALHMISQKCQPSRQADSWKTYLSSMRVSDFVSPEIEVSTALAKVYRIIPKLSRQVPASQKGDAH